jgi:alkanesulfonate monooxygenase SsuD/methylene tetrahydromethanopterin reductase-like flavin-dependent oxidoreductase (luciferase family)
MSTGLDVGLVLLMVERPGDGAKPTWADIARMARRGEELGADTVWVPDEIVWRDPEWPGPRGWWDCLTMTGAIAASTSTVKVGTWVMSALQHNPGMVVRAAESLDEISGGRFVLGLGSGHGGGAEAFGYPGDKAVSRYIEALEIIMPLLRGESDVTFDGQFHHAMNAEVRPRGPRPGRIPLMMGGHADRTMTAAARHADTWSGYARSSSGSLPEAFAEMTSQLDRVCEAIGRDPATIGRSVGVFVEPGNAKLTEATGFGVAISGSVDQIIETIAGFSGVGVTRVEVIPWPTTLDVVEQLAPVFATFAAPED